MCCRFLVVAGLLHATLPAYAAPDPVAAMLGETTRHLVAGDETFVALMVRYHVGFTELAAANPGTDPWIPKPGTVLDIPTAHLLPETPRRGIVVNLGDQRLYWFPGPSAPPQSFPIGVGREGWQTPLGDTVVAGKRKDPVWTPPASIRAERPELPAVVAAGPANPLGTFALDLGWDSYVIHGTNRPGGIGRRVSHGCIRLANEDIGRLFADVPVGTPVTVIDEPVKLGWHQDALWLEAHPDRHQADELEDTGNFTPAPASGIGTRILAAVNGTSVSVDWSAVNRVVSERRGVPVRIAARRP